MRLKVFTLYDTKAQYFNTPFFFAHIGQAIRACIDLGSDLSTNVGRYPADFTLYEIGEYEDQTPLLIPCNPISHGPVAAFLPQPTFSFERNDQRKDTV